MLTRYEPASTSITAVNFNLTPINLNLPSYQAYLNLLPT